MSIRHTVIALCTITSLGVGAAQAADSSSATSSTPTSAPAAQMTPPPGMGPMGGPRAAKMMRWAAHAPLPPLLPIVLRNSSELNLTTAQKETFDQWRRTHLGKGRSLMETMRRDGLALHDAIFKGEPEANLQPLLRKLEADRDALMQLRLAEVLMVRKTLTPAQWQQLDGILQKAAAMPMGRGRGMGPKGGVPPQP